MDVQPLTQEHLPSVEEIERACFAHPWSQSSLALLLTPPNGGFVCVEKGEVVGYVGFLGVIDELEITNVAVRPDCRRRGFGEALIEALTDYARTVGAVRVTLDVRVSNHPAVALYQKMNFTPCGVRKNFYSAPREDAMVMETRVQ